MEKLVSTTPRQSEWLIKHNGVEFVKNPLTSPFYKCPECENMAYLGAMTGPARKCTQCGFICEVKSLH